MANFTVNQGTNIELYAGSLTGGTIVGVMRLDVGTGATTSPWGGTILSNQNLEKGTITALAAGTITNGTFVMPSGTLNVGTVVNNGGTIQNLNAGTITALATGTITGGTLQNLVSGTINALASGTITGGTVNATIKNSSGAELTIGAFDSDARTFSGFNAISVADFGFGYNNATWDKLRVANAAANTVGTGLLGVGIQGQDSGGTYHNIAVSTGGSVGTIILPNIPGGTLTNLVSGTINALASGTITGGTLGNLNYGTVNIDPTPIKIAPLIQGTLGTAGGSFFGTLSAASGAGTKHYITGLSVIGQAGTADVRILAGTSIQGTGVLGAGNVVPGGGYIRDFVVPFATGTGSELTYHFVGAGTAFIVINYWKGA